jgi:hypothetical protein
MQAIEKSLAGINSVITRQTEKMEDGNARIRVGIEQNENRGERSKNEAKHVRMKNGRSGRRGNKKKLVISGVDNKRGERRHTKQARRSK